MTAAVPGLVSARVLAAAGASRFALYLLFACLLCWRSDISILNGTDCVRDRTRKSGVSALQNCRHSVGGCEQQGQRMGRVRIPDD